MEETANDKTSFNSVNLESWDIVVIVAYFVAVMAVGIWSSWRSSRGSMSGYFLASRSMHWIPVGASLFASNIGSGHFVGLAGSGAATGIGIAGFELNAVFVLMILGWFFVPVYVASGVYTMPEYLRKRFGGQRIRVYLSVLALLLSIFTKISADLFAGAIFIKQALDWNLYVSVCVLLAIACIFTVAGGLSAVIWTDFVQTILIVVGAFALMVLSFIKVGGYEKLMRDFAFAEPTNNSFVQFDADNTSCSKVPDNYNHLLRTASDPQLPWTGMVFGLTISGIWYWCSDQTLGNVVNTSWGALLDVMKFRHKVDFAILSALIGRGGCYDLNFIGLKVIVQRALSAKNMVHAKAGCILAGYLKLLPLYLLVLPGMAARVLYPDLVGCSNPDRCREVCGSENGCTNIAYPLLVVKLMPIGARGMMLSVMLAALMSSLTSIFNSSSTIFTIDIWKKFRKQASDVELLIVGRSFVVVLVALSIVWIPIIEHFPSSQLFHYIQSVTSYLAPPVCAVYVMAVSWKRVNESGAFWGLMIGLAVGIARFAWEFSYAVPTCGTGLADPRPSVISQVHYLHFGAILFLISLISTAVISLLTPPIDERHLYRLTFSSRFSTEVREELDRPQKKVPPTVSAVTGGADNLAYNKSTDNLASNDVPMTIRGHTSPHEVMQAPRKELHGFKKALFCVCGVTSTHEQEQEMAANQLPPISPEQEAHEAVKALDEHRVWGTACTLNAVILIAVCAFVWGFYA